MRYKYPDLSPEQYDVLKAFTSLFNKDEQALKKSTNIIEKYILDKQDLCPNIPPGLVQALFGGLWDFPELLAKGVTRAYNS